MRNFPQLALRLGLGALVALILLAVVGRLAFNRYLHSDGFRQKIGDITARALKADGEYQPLRITGATVYTDGFHARGASGAFFEELRADEIRADLNWHGLLHRAWQIDQIAIQRLEVRLADRPSAPPPTARSSSTASDQSRRWKLDLRRAEIADSRWRWSGGEATGTALTLTPAGEDWQLEAAGGQIRLAGWPEFRLDSAHLRYRGDTLYLTESKFRGAGGVLGLTGEWSSARGSDFQANLDGLDIALLLTPDWRARLTGQVYGELHLREDTTSGSLRFGGAQLTALPILDQIALFTQSQRFRTLVLTQASLDFTRTAERFTARQVVAESEGLLRVEGSFNIVGDQVDGVFQVGVTPSSLQWLPGSRARVFTTERGGYLWAPMRLTGPLAHPTEDLSPRLIHAAAGEVIEGVEQTVRDATRGLQETAKDLINRLLK